MLLEESMENTIEKLCADAMELVDFGKGVL